MTVSRAPRDEERAAGNQMLFREFNERVKRLNDRADFESVLDEWLCECASPRCLERIAMFAEEYERVRQDGACFLVAGSDEHVGLDFERVIERNDRYWIIEKLGNGAELTRRSDPRSNAGPLRIHT
jgi:hypothetical protein